MADDIVIQLRAGGRSRPEPLLCDLAADEIERLQAKVRDLQGKLGDVLGERDYWKWGATANE